MQQMHKVSQTGVIILSYLTCFIKVDIIKIVLLIPDRKRNNCKY